MNVSNFREKFHDFYNKFHPEFLNMTKTRTYFEMHPELYIEYINTVKLNSSLNFVQNLSICFAYGCPRSAVMIEKIIYNFAKLYFAIRQPNNVFTNVTQIYVFAHSCILLSENLWKMRTHNLKKMSLDDFIKYSTDESLDFIPSREFMESIYEYIFKNYWTIS